MEHLGSDSVVTADIVGQRLGAVLGQGHIVRHAAFGRSVTGDVDTDNPDVGIFLYQLDGVGNGVQFGTVVLESGQYIITVLPELQPGGAGFGTHFHGFRFRGYAVELVIGDIGRKYARPQGLLRLALVAVHAAVYLFADFDPPVEHPTLVGHGGRIIVMLPLAAVAYDYLCGIIVERGKLHAFEPLRPQVNLVAGLAIDDYRGKGHLAATVRRHEYGCQCYGVLRTDFRLAQIDGHRQLYRAALLDDPSLTNPDQRQVTGFVLGMQHHGTTCQYQQ